MLTLVFRARIGEPEPYDRVGITGTPLDVIVNGGANGDTATGAIVVNAIPVLAASPPGLRTMADVAVLCRADGIATAHPAHGPTDG